MASWLAAGARRRLVALRRALVRARVCGATRLSSKYVMLLARANERSDRTTGCDELGGHADMPARCLRLLVRLGERCVVIRLPGALLGS